MKKNRVIIVLCTLIFLISIFILKYNSDNSLFDNKYIYNLNVNYDEIQNSVDREISKYIYNKKINMNNPKVILNPYNSSPLTALVIFYTEDKTSIKLYINDIYMTTVESSNSHVIPIYGLREDYNNEIKIIDDNNNESVINIKTDKLENSNFYDYKVSDDVEEQLFINSRNGKYAVDNDGYITWYMDINNGEFDISKREKLYFIDKYYRIMETDFMGRVYRIYSNDIVYNNHIIKKLKNNNIMTINSNFVISLIEYDTGKILFSINMIDIFKDIDENFDIPIDSNYINYFQYNEEDNTVLISIRGCNAIINYDISNNKILWIFSDSEVFSNKFNDYKLNLINGDYFIGQHTPYLDGNKLYVFNNNNLTFTDVKYSNAKKSSAIIYEIDGMNIKEIYKYNSVYSSGWYGNFYKEGDIKFINFGCIVGEDEGNYSKIIELDEEDNIISEFTTHYNDIIVYQSFRENFYNETTSNYEINLKLENFYTKENDTSNKSIHYIKNDKDIKEKIENSIIDEGLIEFSNEGFNIDTVGDIEILFVDKKYHYYKLDYEIKKSNIEGFVYIWNYLIDLKGKYSIYIKINDKYYNTNLVFNMR